MLADFFSDFSNLFSLIDNFVKITLKNGSILEGWLFTIDPVSMRFLMKILIIFNYLRRLFFGKYLVLLLFQNLPTFQS